MGRLGVTVTRRQVAWSVVVFGAALVVAALTVLFGVLFGAVFALVTGLFLSGVVLAVLGLLTDVDKSGRR